MTIKIDPLLGEEAALILYHAFSTTGILGQTEMPEDILPASISPGSLEHILFLTLTVSIDYQRDAIQLWASSRKTYEDPDTRYLFVPSELRKTPLEKIREDMQKYSLSRKHQKDPLTWFTLGTTFFSRWGGDPRNLIDFCDSNAVHILDYIRTPCFYTFDKKEEAYPFLRGEKIGPLWLRMLRDNYGIEDLQNLDKIPIPVDIHVGRATLALGVVAGNYSGSFSALFEDIRKAWFESVRSLMANDRPMIALDVDEPLWHLSKYGCKNRDKESGICPKYDDCEMKDLCICGEIDINTRSKIILHT